MTDLWLPYLAFSLLMFVLMSHINHAKPWLWGALLCSVLLSWLPLQGMSLALQLRTYLGDLSISSLVLLSYAALTRFAVPAPKASHRMMVLGVFAAMGVCLYPAALGLSYVDPYLLGFEPRPQLLLVGVLCALFIMLRNWLGALALMLATLAFTLRLNASENYWDYLIDPYLTLYSIGAVLVAALTSLVARVRRSFTSQIRANA